MALSDISCSPFTQAVVSSMRKLYPEEYAERSFDNTGLLLEAPFEPTRRQKNSVLLAIDLTTAVADEAIQRQVSIVVAYHPFIFNSVKSITLGNPQQRAILRLVQHGISVYSPHTALDKTVGGMTDWLCDVVTGLYNPAAKDSSLSVKSCDASFYSAPIYPQPQNVTITSESFACQQPAHTRVTIHPHQGKKNKSSLISTGAGRLVTFEEAQPLTKLIDFIGYGTGLPGGIPIATPQTQPIDRIHIRTVGLCAGAGSAVLLRSGNELPDLFLTGEMDHHETLGITERGSVVIALGHSDSERGFLRAVLQNRLHAQISQQWENDRGLALEKLQKNDLNQDGATPSSLCEAYNDVNVEVLVSEIDRDPYGIMIRKD